MRPKAHLFKWSPQLFLLQPTIIQDPLCSWSELVFIVQSLVVPSISTLSQNPPYAMILHLCSSHSLFFILPFFWPPRPKPDFFTSPSHCLFLVRSFFRPPPCRNWCFWFFLRCFRICSLVFSSERTTRPPGVCCCLAGLWKLGPSRPRPRPERQMTQKGGLLFDSTCWNKTAFTLYRLVTQKGLLAQK